MQRADVAMYRAKAGHGNGVAFYEAISDENTPRRLTLGSDLRAAIAEGQLSLVFQPQVRLSDGLMLGAEALVRWRHPTLGQIMPDEFISLAERTGAINDLTERVLADALDQAKIWRDAGREWNVAVNIATRNLLENDFVGIVERLLQAKGVDPSALILEITETSMMSDTSKTVDVLEGLAALGITLSVDDFGTGYSSLSYLQQLPVKEVKIDKMFVSRMVSDPGADAIVRSVLDLARNLNLKTVAEGVEDAETLEQLRGLGCDIAQGYFLSRPVTANELEDWHQHLPELLRFESRRHAASTRYAAVS
jgi:EAL domain-containing protein (putative c-di-GMP-specific phosphodiesterase class I)